MMKVRVISLMLCFVMLGFVFVGCGATNSGGTNEEVATNEQTATTDNAGTTNENKDTKADASGVKKKIVVLKEAEDVLRDQVQKSILSSLASGGYTNENAEITELKMEGDDKKAPDLVNKIKEMKADVVIINQAYVGNNVIAKPLIGSGIPVILTYGVEYPDFIDENDMPKDNVTGVYTMPKDMLLNGYKLLQKIYPTNGKKAVFYTVSGFDAIVGRDKVEAALKEVGVELKDYCSSQYVEDYQASVLKYQNDPEVAWNLVGIWPGAKKDGTTQPFNAVAGWDLQNRKKPTVTFWSSGVEAGVLCGLAVALDVNGQQAAEMAVRILKGEKVKDIKAQMPRKSNIELNQARADMLGIKFPADILGSAAKVYTTTILDAKK